MGSVWSCVCVCMGEITINDLIENLDELQLSVIIFKK